MFEMTMISVSIKDWDAVEKMIEELRRMKFEILAFMEPDAKSSWEL